METPELIPILVVASLFTSELADMERVAKASNASADPLVTSNYAAYSTLRRLGEEPSESLPYSTRSQPPETLKRWLSAILRLSTLH